MKRCSSDSFTQNPLITVNFVVDNKANKNALDTCDPYIVATTEPSRKRIKTSKTSGIQQHDRNTGKLHDFNTVKQITVGPTFSDHHFLERHEILPEDPTLESNKNSNCNTHEENSHSEKTVTACRKLNPENKSTTVSKVKTNQTWEVIKPENRNAFFLVLNT